MLYVLLVVLVFAIVLGIVNKYVAMDPPVRTTVNLVAVVFLLFWLFTGMPIPHMYR